MFNKRNKQEKPNNIMDDSSESKIREKYDLESKGCGSFWVIQIDKLTDRQTKMIIKRLHW